MPPPTAGPHQNENENENENGLLNPDGSSPSDDHDHSLIRSNVGAESLATARPAFPTEPRTQEIADTSDTRRLLRSLEDLRDTLEVRVNQLAASVQLLREQARELGASMDSHRQADAEGAHAEQSWRRDGQGIIDGPVGVDGEDTPRPIPIFVSDASPERTGVTTTSAIAAEASSLARPITAADINRLLERASQSLTGTPGVGENASRFGIGQRARAAGSRTGQGNAAGSADRTPAPTSGPARVVTYDVPGTDGITIRYRSTTDATPQSTESTVPTARNRAGPDPYELELGDSGSDGPEEYRQETQRVREARATRDAERADFTARLNERRRLRDIRVAVREAAEADADAVASADIVFDENPVAAGRARGGAVATSGEGQDARRTSRGHIHVHVHRHAQDDTDGLQPPAPRQRRETRDEEARRRLAMIRMRASAPRDPPSPGISSDAVDRAPKEGLPGTNLEAIRKHGAPIVVRSAAPTPVTSAPASPGSSTVEIAPGPAVSARAAGPAPSGAPLSTTSSAPSASDAGATGTRQPRGAIARLMEIRERLRQADARLVTQAGSGQSPSTAAAANTTGRTVGTAAAPASDHNESPARTHDADASVGARLASVRSSLSEIRARFEGATATGAGDSSAAAAPFPAPAARDTMSTSRHALDGGRSGSGHERQSSSALGAQYRERGAGAAEPVSIGGQNARLSEDALTRRGLRVMRTIAAADSGGEHARISGSTGRETPRQMAERLQRSRTGASRNPNGTSAPPAQDAAAQGLTYEAAQREVTEAREARLRAYERYQAVLQSTRPLLTPQPGGGSTITSSPRPRTYGEAQDYEVLQVRARDDLISAQIRESRAVATRDWARSPLREMSAPITGRAVPSFTVTNSTAGGARVRDVDAYPPYDTAATDNGRRTSAGYDAAHDQVGTASTASAQSANALTREMMQAEERLDLLWADVLDEQNRRADIAEERRARRERDREHLQSRTAEASRNGNTSDSAYAVSADRATRSRLIAEANAIIPTAALSTIDLTRGTLMLLNGSGQLVDASLAAAGFPMVDEAQANNVADLLEQAGVGQEQVGQAVVVGSDDSDGATSSEEEEEEDEEDEEDSDDDDNDPTNDNNETSGRLTIDVPAPTLADNIDISPSTPITNSHRVTGTTVLVTSPPTSPLQPNRMLIRGPDVDGDTGTLPAGTANQSGTSANSSSAEKGEMALHEWPSAPACIRTAAVNRAGRHRPYVSLLDL